MKSLTLPLLLSFAVSGCAVRIADEPDVEPQSELPREPPPRPDAPSHDSDPDPAPAPTPSPDPAPSTPTPSPSPGWGTPVCVDDTAENDDVFEDGQEIVPLADGVAYFDRIANDDDWMWINALPGEAIEIQIEHDTPGADLDLIVYDAVDVVDHVWSDAPYTPVSIFVPATDAGQFIDVLVSPYSGPDECLPYTVTVFSSLDVTTPAPPPPPPPAPTCFNDDFEPNDTLAGAWFADAPLYDLVLDASDVDLFAVEVYPGEELFVWSGADSVYGDVDLRLLDAWGSEIAVSATDGDEELLSYVHSFADAEVVYIETVLWAATSDTCQIYDLDWWIEPGVCLDDGFESNNTWDDAQELIPDTGWSITYDLVSGLDEDWFYVQTLPWESVDVILEHSTAGGDLDVTVWDSFGELGFDIADAPYDAAWVTSPATETGDMLDILVTQWASPDSCVPYTLTLESY